MQTAEANGIPFQIRQPGGGGTNTGAIERSHAGTLSATIAVPERYAHTPYGMINLNDFQAAEQLADAVLRSLSPDILLK
jgi:endoglucanase